MPGEFGRDGHHRTSRWLFDCAFAPLPRHGANRAHGGAGFPVRESARSPRRAPAPHAAGKAGACGFAAISRLPACHVARKIHHELVATTSVAEQPVSANCGAQQSDLSWAQPHNAVALNENFLPSKAHGAKYSRELLPPNFFSDNKTCSRTGACGRKGQESVPQTYSSADRKRKAIDPGGVSASKHVALSKVWNTPFDP